MNLASYAEEKGAEQVLTWLETRNCIANHNPHYIEKWILDFPEALKQIAKLQIFLSGMHSYWRREIEIEILGERTQILLDSSKRSFRQSTVTVIVDNNTGEFEVVKKIEK